MSVNNDIQEVLNVLRSGGTILYPTDTIWGIGCNATNPKAVEKIYRIKERVFKQSLIILVKDLDMLRNYVESVPEIAIELMMSVPEPLTIIYPNARNLPRNVLAGDGSIAIRIPKHDFCQDLLDAFGKPVTSTSANLSGAPNPYSFGSIAEPVKNSVDYIVSNKHQSFNRPKPSTIVKINQHGEISVLRT